jgi:hypothetical protein
VQEICGTPARWLLAAAIVTRLGAGAEPPPAPFPPEMKLVAEAGASYDFCLTAPVTVTKINVFLMDDASKRALDPNILTFPKPWQPDTNCLKAEFKDALLKDVVKAVGTVHMLFTMKSGESASAAKFSIELYRPVSTIKIGAKDEVNLQFRRSWPFTTETVCKCAVYRVLPGGNPLPPNLSLPADITGWGDTSNVNPDGAKLTATTHVSKKGIPEICFHVTFPGEFTALRGSVWTEPPKVAAETPIAANFRIKDHWKWRALAVAIAYGLALLLTWVMTHVRRRLLNDIRRSTIRGRLDRALAANPALAGSATVVFVQELLAQSVVQDKAGDFDDSAQSMTSAEGRMDTLESATPPQPVSLGASQVPAIRVLDPQANQIAGARLTLLIESPPWAKGTLLQWSVDNSIIASGVDLYRVNHAFPKAQDYNIQVVDHAGVTPLNRVLVIVNPGKRSLAARLQLTDMLPYAIGVLVAIATGYAATASAESWGTPGDYAVLLGAAFGVTAGVQGLAPLVTLLRR